LSYSISDMLQLWVNGYNLLNTKYQINAGFPMPGITFMGGINLNI
ncbi:MAG TPA: TonB-dependent receptor, partial [Bacteroidaceae bacterium]|nr:TonB-dependent receptor [Bacteroidaceae bacterium]